jgi:hypothetical protein
MACALGALMLCALVWASPASASVSVGDVQVGESGSATFTITRSAGLLAGATSVAFRTAGRSAGAADYTADSGTRAFPATIAATTQFAYVSIPIAPDALDEPNETFVLEISGAEVTDGEATATIVDDDPAPSLSVTGGATVREGAGEIARFVVALTAPSGRTVSVDYTTANQSATAGQDYVAKQDTVRLAPGATEALVDVALLDDTIDEPAETFELRLGTPSGAVAGVGTASATIVDDDEPPAPPAPEPPPPPAGTATPPSAGTQPPASPGAPTTGSTASRQGLGLSSPRLKRPSTVLVTISCPQSAGRCSGRVTLFSVANRRSRVKALRKERKLGRAEFSVAAGSAQTVSLALGRTDVGLLKRTGRMKVRAYAITQDGAGRTGVRSVGGTLVARTAHSSPGRD